MAAKSGGSSGGSSGGAGIAAGAGLGMQIGAAIGSFYAANSAARVSGKISAFNTRVGEMQARWAEERGVEAVYRHRLKMRGLRGAQRASFAGQNVVVGDGTALEVEEDTAKWTEVDALTIKNNAALEAWGYKQQAISSSLQGALSGGMQGMGTLLTGLGGAAKDAYVLFGDRQGSGAKPAAAK